MVPTITTILQRFSAEWAALLQPDAILTVCRESGYTAWRDRILTPVTTVQLFLLQVLHGNTACSHLPHLSGLRFSAAAYCQARAKLPLPFFALLLERFGSAVQRSALDEGRWHGHRTFFVDGSGCSMPDTPALQDAFGRSTEQRPGCGFPVARLLGLVHAGTGLLLKLVVAPLLTHDLAQVQAVHPSLQPGDVLVADWGLCSYAHLAPLAQAGVHAVLRVGVRQIVNFTPGRPFVTPGVRRTPAVKGVPRSRWLTALGHHDQLVAWLKPKTWPSWLARETLAALPDTLLLREVRYHIGTPGFRTRQITLVTTLLDAKVYSVTDLTELYHQRWQVEVYQTQPVTMTWCPLRRAFWVISDLRGPLKREPVGDIHVLGRHDDFTDQAVHHRLAFFTREPVQIGPQPPPKGFGVINALLPLPRPVLHTSSWLTFLRDRL
jgi:hypothetical protein